MIDSNVLEKALFDWVIYLSGYATTQVIFKYQDGNAPSGNYLTIFTGDINQLGFDAISQNTDLLAPPGQEITITAEGDRELVVTIEAYTPLTIGPSAARAVLGAMLSKSNLPHAAEILDAAGLSHFDPGGITYLPTIKEVNFQGRGVWECRMYARDSASEKTTYIERVEITDTRTGNVIVVDT